MLRQAGADCWEPDWAKCAFWAEAVLLRTLLCTGLESCSQHEAATDLQQVADLQLVL